MQRKGVRGSSADDRTPGVPASVSSLGRPPQPADPGPVTVVRISTLTLGPSPRLEGEDEEHARLLAGTDTTLPPILVHRQTMRVIDGMHRLRARQIKGEDTITARFYDGTVDAAFVVAVERNVTHGLPLSTADRKAAAARIIKSHLHWSSRAIAACTGLSDRTVRTIRQHSTAELPQSKERIGQDGRTRPLNIAGGRLRASEIIAARPTTSLRAVAKAAGVSLGTAHDVRERMRRGDDPVPVKYGAVVQSERPTVRRQLNPPVPAQHRGLQATLESLKKDPSLRFTDAGRSALRWLGLHAIDSQSWESLADGIPPHCTEVVAELARCSADAWQELALELEQRGCMAS
jgi:hypothetical protein